MASSIFQGFAVDHSFTETEFKSPGNIISLFTTIVVVVVVVV